MFYWLTLAYLLCFTAFTADYFLFRKVINQQALRYLLTAAELMFLGIAGGISRIFEQEAHFLFLVPILIAIVVYIFFWLPIVRQRWERNHA